MMRPADLPYSFGVVLDGTRVIEMRPITRRLDDTPTLLVVGAAAGAIAGAATIALFLLAASGSFRALALEALVIGAGIGAPLGAVLLPLALRLVIPHVPLGRAAVATIVGTTIGGTLASFLAGSLGGTVFGGFVGFVVAVVALDLTSDSEV